jgi:hexosaminidase
MHSTPDELLIDPLTETEPEIAIIPRPTELRRMSGVYVLPSRPQVEYAAKHGAAARHLQQALMTFWGCQPETNQLSSDISHADIVITNSAASQDSGDESYVLEVSPTQIRITAAGDAGAFYAVQSLLQLLPVNSHPASDFQNRMTLPCVRVVDRPRFRWRGLMLDVSRHFLPVRDVKRFLDSMAMHKLNVLHWHLVDNQGWRVESRKRPRLNEIGAWRQGAKGQLASHLEVHPPRFEGVYGGYYSHDDIREIVAYAVSLHITVIPELELPGHALAALASYPELSCTGGPFEVMAQIGTCMDVFCAGNDGVFTFIEEMIDEWLPLFRSKYFHIGGDECPKDRWKACPKCQARIRAVGLKDEFELQSHFIRRVSQMLKARGKELIGWDEILEGGLVDDATVMSWRGTAGGIAAAKSGHDVVMSPYSHCYLDYRQADRGEPEAMGDQTLTLADVYSFDPIPTELTAAQSRHILGVQGNVWTEHMFDIDQIEYMVWPRAAAIAEIGWTDQHLRDATDFMRRAVANERRLVSRGVNVRRLR